jgi:uncharacterized protein YbaA (DUF1428 family)
MAKYVDGYVLVVKKDKLDEYKKMAEEGAEIWIKNGALEYMECVGDDLEPQQFEGMTPLAFTEMAKAKPDETVIFSFIVYKSREHRDMVNAKVMEHMASMKDKYKDAPMPFDTKRMAYGGFETIVEA